MLQRMLFVGQCRSRALPALFVGLGHEDRREETAVKTSGLLLSLSLVKEVKRTSNDRPSPISMHACSPRLE